MCLFVRVDAKIHQRPENLYRRDHTQTTPVSCTSCPSFHDAGCPHESVGSLVPLSVCMNCNHLKEHQLCVSYSDHVKALKIHFKSVEGRCLQTAAPCARESRTPWSTSAHYSPHCNCAHVGQAFVNTCRRKQTRLILCP